MIPIESQFFSLFAMVLLGIVMGIVFDTYRELRCTFRLKAMATNLWDLLVWIALAVIAFVVLLFTNNGQVRFYIFVELAIGLIFYFVFLSNPSRKAIRIALYIFFRIVAAIWWVMRIPLGIIQRILTVPANLISLMLLKTLVPPFRKCKALSLRFKRKKKS